ncbi:hypothetical protein VTL71DRAFT_7421 [Oculimacula yallundae]|uniref:Serine hydrolase domain-containing protein n=1 Tax=Oculimacula yallundae TaxID=86028 RepID=A0ABR4BWP1_9HELO
MKILCLHGMGTSGAIFEAQTSAFRSKLDPSRFTFDFIDAPFPSPPAFGVEVFFPPPNYTFWTGIDPVSVLETHQWLSALFASRAPYDAVMCFSQGCSLISSFILHHNNERPEEALPFKGAIFICGGLPLQILGDLGLPVPERAWDINAKSGKQLAEVAASASGEIEKLLKTKNGTGNLRQGLWDNTDDLSHDVTNRNFPDDPSDVFGLDMEAFPEGLKIGIPTVHLFGIKDPRYPASIQLAHFSRAAKRRTFEHGGGHDIPRTTVVSNQIAELIVWLEEQIELE